MSTPRPFRFGIQASGAADRAAWVSLAQRAETNGFDVLTMPDHFGDQLAPVPALMTAADATTTLRIGALVWDNDYKHPIVLAKELATMDVLSEGRLEIGIGAGWMISDYEEAGMPYDSPKVRIDRFVEGLAVIKAAMGAGPFSHSGEHYTITNHNGLPKPVQGPCPPILIGGGGKRVLGIAAREADIIGINGTMTAGVVGPDAISTMTAEAVDEKVDIVRAAAGDRLADIEMNVRVFIVKSTETTEQRDEFITTFSGAIGVPASFMIESPFALVGPPEQMIEDLLARRERWGFSYAIVGAEDVESFAPVVAALAGK
ncbi:MAG: putative oxidoreductase [Ilumatobacteraceae bacterium]|nr:putative oxidoreductase [Ilumatobacteraceae bacterium]